eukprot:PhM_4_TR14124/c1_g1_i1/m.92926
MFRSSLSSLRVIAIVSIKIITFSVLTPHSSFSFAAFVLLLASLPVSLTHLALPRCTIYIHKSAGRTRPRCRRLGGCHHSCGSRWLLLLLLWLLSPPRRCAWRVVDNHCGGWWLTAMSRRRRRRVHGLAHVAAGEGLRVDIGAGRARPGRGRRGRESLRRLLLLLLDWLWDSRRWDIGRGRRWCRCRAIPRRTAHLTRAVVVHASVRADCALPRLHRGLGGGVVHRDVLLVLLLLLLLGDNAAVPALGTLVHAVARVHERALRTRPRGLLRGWRGRVRVDLVRHTAATAAERRQRDGHIVDCVAGAALHRARDVVDLLAVPTAHEPGVARKRHDRVTLTARNLDCRDARAAVRWCRRGRALRRELLWLWSHRRRANTHRRGP